MTSIPRHISRFILIVILQVLILNKVEFGFGIQVMIYPLFIMLLPIEMGVFPLMFIAFGMGMLIDAPTDSYGLHTSALVLFAYLRPMILKLFAPREGYEVYAEASMFGMGMSWFIRTFGILLAIHHLWYFILEQFKFNEVFYILQKTILSLIVSFLVCLLYQYLFLRKRKKSNEI